MRKFLIVLACIVLFLALRSERNFSLRAQAGAGGIARENGDVNGDLRVDLADPIYLIEWLFRGGPAPVAFAQEDEEEDERGEFSNSDLRGPYGFSFDGFVTLTLEDGSPLTIPVTAVGRLVADGEGGAPEGSRTLNFGGLVILEQVASGTYQVNPDGTGTFQVEVTTVNVIGTPPPGVVLPPSTLETFSFVLNQPENEAQFIGTGVFDPATGTPLLAPSLRGVARRQ